MSWGIPGASLVLILYMEVLIPYMEVEALRVRVTPKEVALGIKFCNTFKNGQY